VLEGISTTFDKNSRIVIILYKAFVFLLGVEIIATDCCQDIRLRTRFDETTNSWRLFLRLGSASLMSVGIISLDNLLKT